MIYRCYLLDETHCIRDREHFHADHEAAAIDRAREFLFATSYAAAELWAAGRLVARLPVSQEPR